METAAEKASRRRFIVPVVAALALAAGLALVVRWVVTTGSRESDVNVAAPYQAEPRTEYSVQDVRPVVPAPDAAPVAKLPAAVEVVQEVEPARARAWCCAGGPEVRASEGKRPRGGSADDLAAEVALLREAKLAGPARRLEPDRRAGAALPGRRPGGRARAAGDRGAL